MDGDNLLVFGEFSSEEFVLEKFGERLFVADVAELFLDFDHAVQLRQVESGDSAGLDVAGSEHRQAGIGLGGGS